MDRYDQPPDILAYLTRRLGRVIKPFPSPSTIFAHTSEYGTPDPCFQNQTIIDIFTQLSRRRDNVLDQAYATVQLMVDRKLGPEWLADRPACIALPILEMMKLCQMAPRGNMLTGLYGSVGREDMELQMKGGVDMEYQPEQDVSIRRKAKLMIAFRRHPIYW